MSEHYLGIDLGSSYTKFVVVDDAGVSQFEKTIPTLSRNRQSFENIISEINDRFSISKTCTTGYGRDSFKGDIQKTELICAAKGATSSLAIHKCIIDIGGEDIKIIECGAKGEVINFIMNDKCSAGTGAFITEIAEKAEIEISEMSDYAQGSTSDRIINSFCTVFAKSEILGWKFNGVSLEDIAKGIYLSIVTRICKLPVQTEIPVYLCGGVIVYHPYLQELMTAELKRDVGVVPKSQLVVALGAALFAREEGN